MLVFIQKIKIKHAFSKSSKPFVPREISLSLITELALSVYGCATPAKGLGIRSCSSSCVYDVLRVAGLLHRLATNQPIPSYPSLKVGRWAEKEGLFKLQGLSVLGYAEITST